MTTEQVLPRTPGTAAELIEVLDTMRAVLGSPEEMDSLHSRAIYRLNQTRLAAYHRAVDA
jgi:hypothetical protein